MSKTYKEKLFEITTFIFDVDGVFTDGTVHVMPDGQLLRRLNVKDGYAIQYAVKKGFNVAVITGGNSISIHDSLQSLGIRHIFPQSKNKLIVFDKFVAENSFEMKEIMYMGDDIPDYEVMKKAGVATCPSDASEEIKAISHYVSTRSGGNGCIRDIIEQTLKVQGKWFHKDAIEW